MIIPAIDLYDGKVVRLKKGKLENITYYPFAPNELFQTYCNSGVSRVHIVDLQGAFDPKNRQLQLISELKNENPNVQIQLGGGIRTFEDCELLFDSGIDFAVISSAFFKSPKEIDKILNKYSKKIIFGGDIQLINNTPEFVISGWLESVNIAVFEYFKKLSSQGVLETLSTEISKDGIGAGPNIEWYTLMLQKNVPLKIQASGGVSTLKDVKLLKKVGVSGVIIGKALLEGVFSIEEAVQCWQNA